MNHVARRAVFGLLVSFALTTPAMAKEGTPSDARKKNDPNEVVCQKEEVLGSRLAVRRVCKTRSEWAAQRQNDRAMVQQTQVGSCQRQAGC